MHNWGPTYPTLQERLGLEPKRSSSRYVDRQSGLGTIPQPEEKIAALLSDMGLKPGPGEPFRATCGVMWRLLKLIRPYQGFGEAHSAVSKNIRSPNKVLKWQGSC